MPKRKRRIRSPHPGVVLRRRTWASGKTTWFARWTDPDTGRVVDTNLSALGLTTLETRREWALARSRSLNERRAALAAGAPTRTHTELDGAIEEYFATRTRLSPRTARTYREGTDRLAAWARETGVQVTEDLTTVRLATFRERLSNEPRRQAQSGAKRGTWAEGAGTRSPYTVNRDLCSVKALLNYWRRLGLVPQLDRDEITDALRPLLEPRPRPRPLKPLEVRALIDACVRHDGGSDLALGGPSQRLTKGPAPSTMAITPFVAFVLLSGCRLGEALQLRWQDVDFDARDAAGEIILEATATKTRHERAIDLSVAPTLRMLLAILRLRAPTATHVFGGDRPLSQGRVVAARKRLIAKHKAPEFNWQRLRQTAGSYLTNAPGIFGAASAFRSARQLGHSVTVAERHYVGNIHVDPAATTLEAAMGIQDRIQRLVASAGGASLIPETASA